MLPRNFGYFHKAAQALSPDIPGVCAYSSLPSVEKFETWVSGVQFCVTGK